MVKKSLTICLLLFLSIRLIVPGSVAAVEENLKRATFLPQWVPQAQFAGYYVAYEKGFYKRNGIDLTILTGGPDCPPFGCLKNGEADFVTMWLAAGIEKRAEGCKLVNIAQIVQRSALMLVTKASSGIKTPQDMNGKKVGLWEEIFQIQPRAFFKKYDLSVEVVPQSYSVNLFLRDGVDVASAMWYNEYHTILNSGLDSDELTPFFFYKHGLNFPEDGIYALEETFTRDPQLCRAFVKASAEGWRYAFEHREEALDIVMRYMEKAHVPATRVHQKWMLDKIADLIMPTDVDVPMGKLSREDYNRTAKVLKKDGFIDDIPAFDTFHKR